MCWVMPPASPAATSVSRIASSSEVLPWWLDRRRAARGAARGLGIDYHPSPASGAAGRSLALEGIARGSLVLAAGVAGSLRAGCFGLGLRAGAAAIRLGAARAARGLLA